MLLCETILDQTMPQDADFEARIKYKSQESYHSAILYAAFELPTQYNLSHSFECHSAK